MVPILELWVFWDCDSGVGMSSPDESLSCIVAFVHFRLFASRSGDSRCKFIFRVMVQRELQETLGWELVFCR
jgi:uncharacterized RDD family membrane protein YckC